VAEETVGRGRRLRVTGVDLGDGKSVEVWFSIEFQKVLGSKKPVRVVSVREYRKHRGWTLPLKLAAEVVARRAQVRAAAARLGTTK